MGHFARRLFLRSSTLGNNLLASSLSTPSYPVVCKTARSNTSIRCYSAISKTMEDAKKRVSLMTEDPGNAAKLKMYALYKQATEGPCNTKKPGVFDFVGQAKWSAWNELQGISKEEAEKQYVDFVDSLTGGVESTAEPPTPAKADPGIIEGLDVTQENGVFTMKLNRPKKLNALTLEIYNGIRDGLNNSANDDSVRVAVLTGEGSIYSSGNDLSNFTQNMSAGPQKMAAEAKLILKDFVDAFINYPKPLVIAVNGPALGITVTTMALADLVYASDTATFHTPFMTLGQSPEGCSSYTFPKIMGYAQANDVLLCGRKLSAQEAMARGLVTDVFPHHEFHQTVAERVKNLASLPPKSLKFSKALDREREKETLMKVNIEECDRLEERWVSEECMNAVMAFLSKKNKL